MEKHGVSISIIHWVAVVSTIWISNQAVAAAGTRDGGGGIGVYCAAKSPQLQLLDLYEARVINKLVPLPPMGDLKEEYYQASVRWFETTKSPVYNLKPEKAKTDMAIDGILSGAGLFKVEFVGHGVLHPTEDATLPVLPRDCEFVQIARNFTPPNSSKILIQIDQSYWDELDSTNKAALLLHETTYAFRYAIDKESLSDNTRFIIGRLFSKNQLTPKFYDMSANRFYKCIRQGNPGMASTTGFYYYQSIVDHRNVISFESLTTVNSQPWRLTFDPGPFDELLTFERFSVAGPIRSEVVSDDYVFRIFKEQGSDIQIELKNKINKVVYSATVSCTFIN